MTLAADQQAMLGLLLEKGQSYADIATLLGVSETEVRERARAALIAIGGEDPDRQVGLTDYLLGKADPIGRADAVRHLRGDREDRALAERLLAELQEIAPGAELPKLPGEARTAPHLRPQRRRRPAEKEAAPRIRSALSRSQARMIVALAAGAVILVVVVLAIAGVFSGGGSSSSASSGPSTNTTANAGGSNAGNSSQGLKTGRPVVLRSVGGSPAKGVAAFGNANGQQAFLDLRVTGLTQIPQSQAYSVWLMFSANGGYPLGVLSNLSSKGATHVQLPIPGPVLAPVEASLRSVQVVVANRADLAKTVSTFVQSVKNKHPKIALHRPGSPVLVASIPRKSPRG